MQFASWALKKKMTMAQQRAVEPLMNESMNNLERKRKHSARTTFKGGETQPKREREKEPAVSTERCSTLSV
jgi:hypothetical protein